MRAEAPDNAGHQRAGMEPDPHADEATGRVVRVDGSRLGDLQRVTGRILCPTTLPHQTEMDRSGSKGCTWTPTLRQPMAKRAIRTAWWSGLAPSSFSSSSMPLQAMNASPMVSIFRIPSLVHSSSNWLNRRSSSCCTSSGRMVAHRLV